MPFYRAVWQEAVAAACYQDVTAELKKRDILRVGERRKFFERKKGEKKAAG